MPKNMLPGERWEINYWAKSEAGFKCERCGRKEDPQSDNMLDVIALDKELPVFKWANLVVLCPSCRDFVQGIPWACLANQLEMFDDFEMRWLRPHLEGLGIPGPYAEVITAARLDNSTVNVRSRHAEHSTGS